MYWARRFGSRSLISVEVFWVPARCVLLGIGVWIGGGHLCDLLLLLVGGFCRCTRQDKARGISGGIPGELFREREAC